MRLLGRTKISIGVIRSGWQACLLLLYVTMLLTGPMRGFDINGVGHFH
jgi:hypothetical protein